MVVEQLAARISAIRQQRLELAQRHASLPAAPAEDCLATDHPYSKLFGHEEAKRLLAGETKAMAIAAKRRHQVLQMSVAKQRVREIATATGLAYGYVVQVRKRLRREGALPPL